MVLGSQRADWFSFAFVSRQRKKEKVVSVLSVSCGENFYRPLTTYVKIFLTISVAPAMLRTETAAKRARRARQIMTARMLRPSLIGACGLSEELLTVGMVTRRGIRSFVGTSSGFLTELST